MTDPCTLVNPDDPADRTVIPERTAGSLGLTPPSCDWCDEPATVSLPDLVDEGTQAPMACHAHDAEHGTGRSIPLDRPTPLAEVTLVDGQLPPGTLRHLLTRHGVQLPETALVALVEDLARVLAASLVSLALGDADDTVRTQEALDALPVESVVRDAVGAACERISLEAAAEGGWRTIGHGHPVRPELPALVLWTGEQ